MLMSKENERSSEQSPQQLPVQKSADMLGDFQVDDDIGIFDLVDAVVEFLPYTPDNARAVKSLSKAWRFAAMMAFHWEGTLCCKSEACCCMLLNPTKLQRPGAEEDAWCCNVRGCGQYCTCNIPKYLKDEEELEGQIGGYPSFEFLGIDLGHCHDLELSEMARLYLESRIPNINRVYFDSWPQDDVVAIRFESMYEKTGAKVSQDINDALLERFGPRNLRLFIAACTPVSPSRLEGCNRLVWLDLRNAHEFADAQTINAIMKLPSLKRLSLDLCHKVPQESLKALREHPTIEALSLGGIAIDEVIEHVSQMKNLKSLDLTHCNHVTSKSIQSLVNNCKGLEALELVFCASSITLDDFKMLAGLTSLRHLDAQRYGINNFDVQHLTANLPQLESLNVSQLVNVHLSDATVASVGNLTKLRCLTFGGMHIADPKDFNALSGLTQLQVLDVGETRGLTSEALTFLQHLVNLHTIMLCGCSALDDGMLVHLQALKKLRRLDLCGCEQITFHDASLVSGLTEIERLDLEGTRIDDKSLENIGAAMTKMRWMTMGGNLCISDTGLEFLRGMRRLEKLDVNDCLNITASGIMHCVEKMNQLKSIDITDCFVVDAFCSSCDNEEDIAMIKNRFPYVKLFGAEANESDDSWDSSWDEEEEEY